MAIRDDVITDKDKLVYQKAGAGQKAGLGKRPAVIVVDVTYDWVGDKSEPILQSQERFPNSCGEAGWKSIYAIQELLQAARSKDVPVFYTTGVVRQHPLDWGRRSGKIARPGGPRTAEQQEYGNTIPVEIAPTEKDIVIQKRKPSAFFATTLINYLIQLEVDSLIICGVTTSGCVRATVIDAFSYDFRVAVVEECTFDRGEVPHKVNLFDMNIKYADVMSLAEVMDYIAGL